MLRRRVEEQNKNGFRTPRVDIFETTEGVALVAEMPGVDKSDFDIMVHDDELTIKGKRKPMSNGLRLTQGEGEHGDYLRVFTLGEELDTSNVGAKLDQGVLTLTISKKAEVLPKKVEIKIE